MERNKNEQTLVQFVAFGDEKDYEILGEKYQGVVWDQSSHC
jgi:hypothetical protein